MYSANLKSCGNPDKGQYRPVSEPRKVSAKSVEKICEYARLYIEENGLGGGNWPYTPILNGEGAEVGNVSYNGRFWPAKKAINTPENQQKVAAAFLEILRGWFKESGVAEINSRHVKNANDHFDANMAMHEAFLKCGMGDAATEKNLNDPDFIGLWNDSWTLAAKLAIKK